MRDLDLATNNPMNLRCQEIARPECKCLAGMDPYVPLKIRGQERQKDNALRGSQFCCCKRVLKD